MAEGGLGELLPQFDSSGNTARSTSPILHAAHAEPRGERDGEPDEAGGSRWAGGGGRSLSPILVSRDNSPGDTTVLAIPISARIPADRSLAFYQYPSVPGSDEAGGYTFDLRPRDAFWWSHSRQGKRSHLPPCHSHQRVTTSFIAHVSANGCCTPTPTGSLEPLLSSGGTSSSQPRGGNRTQLGMTAPLLAWPGITSEQSLTTTPSAPSPATLPTGQGLRSPHTPTRCWSSTADLTRPTTTTEAQPECPPLLEEEPQTTAPPP
eukprot:2582255-Rhodomonas_salina.1